MGTDKVISLISKSGNATHWGPRDVLSAAMDNLKSGDIGENDRMLVISTGPRSDTFNTRFIQCGMSASEMIMLLEIAKQDIYRTLMAKGEEK